MTNADLITEIEKSDFFDKDLFVGEDIDSRNKFTNKLNDIENFVKGELAGKGFSQKKINQIASAFAKGTKISDEDGLIDSKRDEMVNVVNRKKIEDAENLVDLAPVEVRVSELDSTTRRALRNKERPLLRKQTFLDADSPDDFNVFFTKLPSTTMSVSRLAFVNDVSKQEVVDKISEFSELEIINNKILLTT